MAGGLLGTSIIAVVQYSSVSAMTQALMVSAVCFAIAIPTLAIFVTELTHDNDEGVEAGALIFVIVIVGYFAAYAGLTALFVHFHVAIGVTFAVLSVVVFGIFGNNRPPWR